MSPYMRWSKLRTSFQFRLFFIFTLLTLLVVILLNFLYIFGEINRAREHAIDMLQQRAKHLADSVRLPLYAENREVLYKMAEQAAKLPEIRAVVISASDGRVLADFRVPDPSGTTEVISQSVDVYSSELLNSIESAITGSKDAPEALIGSVRMERGTADLSRAVRKIVILSVGMSMLFWLTVSLLCYQVLRRLTRSFNSLLHGINALEEGDLSFRISIESDDEPGRAALAINNLASTLQERNEENSRLEEERLDLERKMLHAQKLESLGIMAGGVAHDFNNLLQSILGNMELAARELPPDSKPQQYIANSMISGRHAANLAGMMLTYVGKGFVTKKKMNLNDLVRENAEMLRSAASASVPIELALSAEIPAMMADEAQIQQLVMNLITNAAESIEVQSGFIRITTGFQFFDQTDLSASLLDVKPEPGHYLLLEVRDNGCGMDRETLKRLFDPFFTTKFTGRGLGMSAVMGIMKTHDGALFVESEPGKGTTFRALFPALESVLPNSIQSHPPPDLPFMPPRVLERGGMKSSLEKPTIPENPLSGLALVVDDEKSVLKVCTKMVTLCGLKVITACDGFDAVSKFRAHADEIDVVLMDLTMPNMDGIAAMSEIHGIKPDTRIILASGFNEEELSKRITGQAPRGFIRKPYSMNLLEAELRRVMQGD